MTLLMQVTNSQEDITHRYVFDVANGSLCSGSELYRSCKNVRRRTAANYRTRAAGSAPCPCSTVAQTALAMSSAWLCSAIVVVSRLQATHKNNGIAFSASWSIQHVIRACPLRLFPRSTRNNRFCGQDQSDGRLRFISSLLYRIGKYG